MIRLRHATAAHEIFIEEVSCMRYYRQNVVLVSLMILVSGLSIPYLSNWPDYSIWDLSVWFSATPFLMLSVLVMMILFRKTMELMPLICRVSGVLFIYIFLLCAYIGAICAVKSSSAFIGLYFVIAIPIMMPVMYLVGYLIGHRLSQSNSVMSAIGRILGKSRPV